MPVRIEIDVSTITRQYLVEELSTTTIAKLHRVSSTLICDRLAKSGVHLRPSGHKRILVPLDQDQTEVIRGELMGDGSLTVQADGVNPYFQWGGKSEEYGRYLHQVLGVFRGGICPYVDVKYGTYWKLWSKASVSFTDLFADFYPQGIKLIPANLQLTPKLLLHWYLGDGSLRFRPKRNPYVRLPHS
jgi:LAGLIDADG DNA endonuclease family